LQIFNPEGKIIKKIIREYDPVPISEEDKEERRKDIRPGRKFEFPRYHSAFWYFKMDDEGRIFVHTWEKPDSSKGYFFDIFDHEGRYIAKIPLNFRPHVLKRRGISLLNDIKSPGNISQFKGERKPKSLKPWLPDTEKRQLSKSSPSLRTTEGKGIFILHFLIPHQFCSVI